MRQHKRCPQPTLPPMVTYSRVAVGVLLVVADVARVVVAPSSVVFGRTVWFGCAALVVLRCGLVLLFSRNTNRSDAIRPITNCGKLKHTHKRIPTNPSYRRIREQHFDPKVGINRLNESGQSSPVREHQYRVDEKYSAGIIPSNYGSSARNQMLFVSA